ncbi:DUF6531 domain-containing protein [Pseudomonas sp.]|uniref:DUF6531 domain-containing protein n=1 Tax=Pseudomonas sp. TaxID=306 RepID=UPI002735D15C|nr:DUF6531 domain-containing protein [Pseudomonas sp.]MDP3817116.1 DUF6531 domain-containing protein [Pseudomonas sp.]
MNQALHLLHPFALNRLSEAQQLINRSLSLTTLILSAVLFTQHAKAADYSWEISGGTLFSAVPSTRGILYPSPSSACSAGTAAYYQPPVSSGHYWYAAGSTLSFEGGTTAICYVRLEYKHHPATAILTLAIYRRGNSCPVNTLYNPTTGGCANDPGKGDPGTCPTPLKADPINISNGNSFQTEVDYPKTGASTLHFTRVYNSLDGLWRHNHSTYLRIVGTTTLKVALVMAHGRESFFTVSGTTVTASPAELGVLVKTADGWLHTAENNERFTFDTTGRLTRWSNSTGATQQLSYANGTVTVSDNLGRTLSFTEDSQHQPLTLSTAGLAIQYEYNANQRLSKLTRTRDGQTEQRLFHYEIPNKPNLLTGITDERGVRFTTWTFDAQDRATSSEHAGGVEHGDVAYNADGSATVTNELGKSTVYRFVNIGGIKRVSAVEGESSANCPNSNSTFTYDERGLLKTKTDNKGNLTTYDYNERGLEVSRTEAAGTPQARTITTEWHPTLFLPVTVTEPARITRYTYDAQGRQLSQAVTPR